MPAELLVTQYRHSLVAVSFVISVLGAYTALWVMSSPKLASKGRISWFNTALAGLALGGVGIWSMHFLGMLAFDATVSVGYRPLETAVSLVAAVVVSTLALGYMAAQPFSMRRLWVAGPLAGLGVAVMHYLGMYGMRFGGYFEWYWALVLLSVLIAVTAATAALWLAFHARKPLYQAGAALLMGAAVCSMHYTGMAAASLLCTTPNRGAGTTGLLRPDDLLACVIVLALGVLTMVSCDVMLQRMQRTNRPVG